MHVRFARAALQRWMEVVGGGQPPAQIAALALLHAVFAVPGVRLGAPSSLAGELLAPLVALLPGRHSRLAHQVPLLPLAGGMCACVFAW